jgi:hypothetical protein
MQIHAEYLSATTEVLSDELRNIIKMVLLLEKNKNINHTKQQNRMSKKRLRY